MVGRWHKKRNLFIWHDDETGAMTLYEWREESHYLEVLEEFHQSENHDGKFSAIWNEGKGQVRVVSPEEARKWELRRSIGLEGTRTRDETAAEGIQQLAPARTPGIWFDSYVIDQRPNGIGVPKQIAQNSSIVTLFDGGTYNPFVTNVSYFSSGGERSIEITRVGARIFSTEPEMYQQVLSGTRFVFRVRDRDVLNTVLQYLVSPENTTPRQEELQDLMGTDSLPTGWVGFAELDEPIRIGVREYCVGEMIFDNPLSAQLMQREQVPDLERLLQIRLFLAGSWVRSAD